MSDQALDQPSLWVWSFSSRVNRISSSTSGNKAGKCRVSWFVMNDQYSIWFQHPRGHPTWCLMAVWWSWVSVNLFPIVYWTCKFCSLESQNQSEISVFTVSKINAHQVSRPEMTSPHPGFSRVRQRIEVGQRQSSILVSGEESSDVQNRYGRMLSGRAGTCG